MPAKSKRTYLSLLAALLCSACAFERASLAPLTAQPVTRPARNFTSFSGALTCMDDMLATQNHRRVLLSSIDIPDRTKKINVGADDMLINAIGHMNRRSKSYVFLDQALVRDGGIIDMRVAAKRSPPRPDYYIRGSISQLDSDVLADDIDLDADREGSSGAGLLDGGFSKGRTVSVVTVDLHLVGFPSRQVVPGLSVSNSMAVVSKGFGAGTGGLINMTGFDLVLEVDRVESHSQAVRNLIELGVIELLGRHSDVAYWECLSAPDTSASVLKRQEQDFIGLDQSAQIEMAQQILSELGLFQGPIDGEMNGQTRMAVALFQDQEGLIANGVVDFDLIKRLHQRRPTPPASGFTGTEVKLVAAPTVQPAPSNDGYVNLYNFVPQ